MFPMSPSQPIATPQSIIPDSGSPPTQSAWQSAFARLFLRSISQKSRHPRATGKMGSSRSQISLSDEHKGAQRLYQENAGYGFGRSVVR